MLFLSQQKHLRSGTREQSHTRLQIVKAVTGRSQARTRTRNRLQHSLHNNNTRQSATNHRSTSFIYIYTYFVFICLFLFFYTSLASTLRRQISKMSDMSFSCMDDLRTYIARFRLFKERPCLTKDTISCKEIVSSLDLLMNPQNR